MAILFAGSNPMLLGNHEATLEANCQVRTLVASKHSPAKATHCNFATSRGCLVGSLAKAGTHGIRLVKTWGLKPIGWFMGKSYILETLGFSSNL